MNVRRLEKIYPEENRSNTDTSKKVESYRVGGVILCALGVAPESLLTVSFILYCTIKI